jgi:hypothetical protein
VEKIDQLSVPLARSRTLDLMKGYRGKILWKDLVEERRFSAALNRQTRWALAPDQKGARNLLHAAQRHHGRPSVVDTRQFQVPLHFIISGALQVIAESPLTARQFESHAVSLDPGPSKRCTVRMNLRK